MEIREIGLGEREVANRFLEEYWGYTLVVLREGERYELKEERGFLALEEEGILGCLMYRIDGERLEILSLCSTAENRGVGTGLMKAAEGAARANGCSRMTVVTTNDNLHAVGFYQRRGMHLCRLYPDAMDWVRRLKPEIPQIGENGIPLRDELELELLLFPKDGSNVAGE